MFAQNKVFRGYAGLFGALAIWTGWMVITRQASSTSLSGAEISVIRFLVSGLLLMPIAVRVFGKDLFSLKHISLALCMGAPYILFAATGMKYSSAAHAATFINGAMVLASVIFSVVLLNSRLSVSIYIGVAVLLLGLFLLGHLTSLNLGDLFFVLSGSMWALYGVLLQRWRVPALRAVVAVNFWSLLLFSLPYVIISPGFLTSTPIEVLVTQGIFQGVFASILAHICFATAVANIGAARVSLFVPTVPVLTGLIGYYVLNEKLAANEWAGIALVTTGIFITKVKWANVLKIGRKEIAGTNL